MRFTARRRAVRGKINRPGAKRRVGRRSRPATTQQRAVSSARSGKGGHRFLIGDLSSGISHRRIAFILGERPGSRPAWRYRFGVKDQSRRWLAWLVQPVTWQGSRHPARLWRRCGGCCAVRRCPPSLSPFLASYSFLGKGAACRDVIRTSGTQATPAPKPGRGVFYCPEFRRNQDARQT